MRTRLSSILLLAVFVSLAAAFTQTDLLKAGYLPKGTEIKELGDGHSTHYSNGDGTITAVIEPAPPFVGSTDTPDALYWPPWYFSGFSERPWFTGEWNKHGPSSMYLGHMYVGEINMMGYTGYEAGWCEWNTAGIPDGSTVTSVVCSTYAFDTGAGMDYPPVVNLYEMDLRPSDPLSYAQPLYNDARGGYNYASYSSPTPGWRWATLNSYARTKLQSLLPSNWFAIGFSVPSGDWDEIGFYGPDASYGARLVVNYTAPSGVDAEVTAIVAPPSSVEWNQAYTPQATVRNNSSTSQTFNVRFKIADGSSYNRTVGTTLGAGASTTLNFPSWTPATPGGPFAIQCSTELGGDLNNANDKKTGSVTVQKTDAEVVAIVSPPSNVNWNQQYTPQATVRNNSTSGKTFNTRFKIGDGSNYNQAVGTTLGAGATTTLDFPSWTPTSPGGPYAIQCSTELTNDRLNTNDKKTGSVTVTKTDAQVVSIDQPSGAVTWGDTIQPVATVRNNGTAAATFDVTFRVEDGSYGYASTKTVTALGPGSSTPVTFDDWLAERFGGPFELACSTRLASDQVPANDTLYRQVSVNASAPTLLAPPNGDTTNSRRPTFEWTGVANVGGYRLMLDPDPDFPSPLIAVPSGTSWSPATDLDDTTWNWRAQGIVGMVEGPWSAVWTLSIDVTPPALPVLLAPVEDTSQNNLPLFDWQPVGDARQFNLALYDAGHVAVPGFPVNVTQAPGADNSQYQLTADAALADGKYTWAVEALDYATNSSGFCAEDWFAVDRTPPAVPVLVAPIGGAVVQTALPKLDWQPVADARRFEVELYRTGQGLVAVWTVDQAAGEDKSEYQLVPGEELADGGQYTWHARARDYALNESDFSGSEAFSVSMPQHDVAVTAILAPAGEIPQNTVVFPRVRVHNAGGMAETFPVRVIVNDPGDGEVFNYAEQVSGLAVGETREFIFTGHSWTATPRHQFAVTAIAELPEDQYRHNDTLAGSCRVVVAEPWPYGWRELANLPALPSTKLAKDGGWLAVATPEGEDDPFVFAAKGNKTGDFYRFDPFAADTGRWTQLESIPAGEGGRAKLPKKGCAATSDGESFIYMTKGNNTLGFWKYDIARDSWLRLPDVPLGGGKKVKGGNDLAYVQQGDTGWVYLVKGYRTEFYRFNTGSGHWDTLAGVPYVVAPKYNMGSFLAYDGGQYLYAHQAKYTDPGKTHHYMFRYDLTSQAWQAETGAKGMPVLGMDGGRMKNKKSKDGAAGAWLDGVMYALKGGNTCQFYSYAPGGDSWTERDTIRSYGSTAKKKKVKAGGDLVYYGYNAFFALKGNKTLEFWRYVVSGAQAQAQAQARDGVASGVERTAYGVMRVEPNPLSGGWATLRYSLPKAGPVNVTILDVAGRSVLRQSSIGNLESSMALDLRGLSTGVYLVRLDANGNCESQKFVIER